jgi:hypothetical protein
MANPNIVNVSTILANTVMQTVSTVATDIVANPASSGTVYKINTISVSNYASNSYAVSVAVTIGGTSRYIARNVVVPAASSLAIVGKDTGFYLLENSSIQVSSTFASAFHAICSWERIS